MAPQRMKMAGILKSGRATVTIPGKVTPRLTLFTTHVFTRLRTVLSGVSC